MKRSTQIVGLDLLRFWAALMVVVYHLGVRTWSADTSMSQIVDGAVRYDALSFAWAGWVGVEMFFVLSGFVIAYSAEGSSAVAFVRSRVLRLVPAVLVCATITLAVQASLGRHDLWEEYFASIFFRPWGPWIDAPYWTLPVEVAFYAVVFVSILVNRFRSIEWIAMAIGLGSSAVWFAHRLGVDVVPFMTHLSNLTLIQHGCFFAIGVLMWLMLMKGFMWRRLAVVAICMAAGWLEIKYMAPMKIVEGGMMRAPGAIWLASLLAIVVSVKWNHRLSGRWNGVARRLGLATYPLYLVHATLGAAIIRWLREAGVPQWPALVVAIACALAIALAVAEWAEPWLRRVLGLPLAWVSGVAAKRFPPLASPSTPVA